MLATTARNTKQSKPTTTQYWSVQGLAAQLGMKPLLEREVMTTALGYSY